MIAKEEVLDLLMSTESYRVERTTSTGNMDKFCEAICAFANDMANSRKNGYLIIGAHDDGSIAGMKLDDALLKKIAGIRSDGNILPLPTMSVEPFSYPEGGLYGEARPENFPSVNDYRNPLVAEAMRVMKYVNKYNRGVTRVQEMLKENCNPPAEFDVNTITAFRVNVHATSESDLGVNPKSTPKSGTSQTLEEMIVEYCREPRSGAEIAAYCGFKDVKNFRERYLTPLIGCRLQLTIPDKPRSRFQKYKTIK